MTVDILHGPNLNLLGRREPAQYGFATLSDLYDAVRNEAGALGLEVSFFQSNHEGELIERIQQAPARGVRAVILNAGAYTHTSVALRDAVLAAGIALVEVHITNVHRRESFRHKSYFADISLGQISGFGVEGYRLALRLVELHLSGLAAAEAAFPTAA